MAIVSIFTGSFVGGPFVEMLKLFLRVWSRFIWIHTTNTLGEQGVALVSHFHSRSVEHVLQASTSAQFFVDS